MRTLSRKEQGELNFWINHIYGLGCETELGRGYIEQWSDGAIARLANYRRNIPELASVDRGVWVDVGCGPYPVLLHAPETTTSICIDPLMKHYFHHNLVPENALRPNLVFIESNIEDLPLPDEQADVVVCTNALDHVEDPWKGLEEMTRVLKVGGSLILEVDVGGDTDYMHPHAFSVDELEVQVSRVGLNNLKGHPTRDGSKRRPGATLYYGFYQRAERKDDIYPIGGPPSLTSMQPVLAKEGVHGFNIVRVGDPKYGGLYFAILQSDGAFFYHKALAGDYKHCMQSNNLEQLIDRIKCEF